MSIALTSKFTGGGSIARRLSWIGSAAIALVMVSVCAVMAWSTARQTREHIVHLASEKTAGVTAALDAFDVASKQVTERFYETFAESFAKEFSLDEASGELRSWGEALNNNFSAVDKFNASTGAMATIFARKGDDFVRISTSVVCLCCRGAGPGLELDPAPLGGAALAGTEPQPGGGGTRRPDA